MYSLAVLGAEQSRSASSSLTQLAWRSSSSSSSVLGAEQWELLERLWGGWWSVVEFKVKMNRRKAVDLLVVCAAPV